MSRSASRTGPAGRRPGPVGLLVVLLVIVLAAAPSSAATRIVGPADPARASGSVSGVVVPTSARGVSSDRFYTRDKHFYRSPWWAGKHRTMIPFGCTRAPYYDPDPRCRRERGFHHGIDIAMPCGTLLRAGRFGRVVRPDSAGALGPAYGPRAFRIRNLKYGVDLVFGHVKVVFVSPGDRVRPGQRIARANQLGTPDGCHLHFEVRPVRQGYESARFPTGFLDLRRAE